MRLMATQGASRVNIGDAAFASLETARSVVCCGWPSGSEGIIFFRVQFTETSTQREERR